MVFVSCDQSEDQMWDYFQADHGDYLVVNYGSELRESIMGTHGVSGIPMLVIMKDDGTVITKSGREDVSKGPAEAFKSWQSKA